MISCYQVKQNMPRKSGVWNHFIRIAEKKVRCNHCDREYKSCGNTSNLLQHLERKHHLSFKSHLPDEEEIELIEPSKSLRSQILIEETYHSLNHSEESCKSFILDKYLMDLIIRVGLNLNIVESEFFHQFVKTLDHQYNLPSKKRLVEMIEKRYIQKKSDVAQFFEQLDSLSLSVDMWTDSFSITYISVTCHFVNGYKRNHLSLGIAHFARGPEPSRIAEVIDDILQEFEIHQDKVIAVVSDCANELKEAVINLFGYNKHHTSFGHLIQQILHDSLAFTPELCRIVETVRQIVIFFKKNKNAREMLLKSQEMDGRIPIKLKPEINGKWTSLYPMISGFVELRKYIESTLFNINCPIELLKEFEYIILEDILMVMKPFQDIADEMCKENFTLLSKQLPLVKCLESYLLSTKPTTSLGKILKNQMLTNVRNQFMNIENNPLIALSTLLDPRFKRLHFHNANSLSSAITLLDQIIRSMPSSNTAMDTIQNSSDNFWAHHESIVQSLDQPHSDINSEMCAELRSYLGYSLIPRTHCPLEYWSNQRTIYPELADLAFKYLTIPTNSIPAINIFTKAESSLTELKTHLKPNKMHKFIFLRDLPNVFS